MYAQDSLNLGALVNSAEEYVLKHDRQMFLPLLRAVEQFAHDKGILIGGRTGSYALCDNPLVGVDVSLWILELFSFNIEQDMKDCLTYLTEKMRELSTEEFKAQQTRPENIYQGDYRTIVLRTTVEEREYSLWADYRLIAIGRSLGERKGIDITSIIHPVVRKGPFGTDGINVMPVDLQIMRVAHMLCDPTNASSWEKILVPQLVDLFAKCDESASTSGGGDSIEPPNKDESLDDSHFDLDAGVIIGEQAVEYYIGVPVGKHVRKQYICSFTGLDEYIAANGMTMRYADLRVPDDFRVRKVVLHRDGRDGRDEVVADLFNTSSYEPIPVNFARNGPLKGRKIASPFTVLRFLFIDIWALSFIIAASRDSSSGVLGRQTFLRKLARRLFDWIQTKCPVSKLFPTEYTGIFIPEGAAKRQVKASHSMIRVVSMVPKKDLIVLRENIMHNMMSI